MIGPGGAPFEHYGPLQSAWAVEKLPTPADLIVYTIDEWRQLRLNSPRFYESLAREAVWLCGAPPPVQ